MVDKKVTEQQFRFSSDELAWWDRDGYLIRLGVFNAEENDVLRQVAEDIVGGKRPFPIAHVDRNALIGDGKAERSGIYAMHKIHHPSSYSTEFLSRTRDPRLMDPLVDLLGPDILGINNLFIWKAPEIGLGFPGIRISSTFAAGFGRKQLWVPGQRLTQLIRETVVST